MARADLRLLDSDPFALLASKSPGVTGTESAPKNSRRSLVRRISTNRPKGFSKEILAVFEMRRR